MSKSAEIYGAQMRGQFADTPAITRSIATGTTPNYAPYRPKTGAPYKANDWARSIQFRRVALRKDRNVLRSSHGKFQTVAELVAFQAKQEKTRRPARRTPQLA